MTKDEALDLALEALEESVDLVREDYENAKKLYSNYPSRQARLLGLEDGLSKHEAAIIAIKQALAAPVQEPVAWMFEFPDKRVKPKFDSAPHGGNWQPLYIQPPPDAYGYAKRLAEAIWKKHYQSAAPQWEPFAGLMGVLTQIDNMTAGLTTPPAAQPTTDESSAVKPAAPVQEPWEPHDTAYRPGGLPQDFIKHEVENEGDWSEWVNPYSEQYFMKCCDCGLVHEMQFKVAKYSESDECEFVADDNLQAVFRARRVAPFAPVPEPVFKPCSCRWKGEEQVQQCTLHAAHIEAIHEWAERAKAAEAKLKEKNT